MSEVTRFGVQRGLFTSLCVLVALIGLYRNFVPSPVATLIQKSGTANQATPTEPATTPPHVVIPRKTENIPASQAQASEQPKQNPKPAYKSIPTEPISGSPNDTALTIQQCIHDGSTIPCWGLISIASDIPVYQCFENSTVTDDLGNQFSVLPQFSGGGLWTTMIPNTNYRFQLTANDPHPAVKTINLLIRIRKRCNNFGGEHHPQNEVVFTNVPVQQ